jgi:S1-C subfamily serine protease
MNANLKWGLASLASVAVAVAITWAVVSHFSQVPVPETDRTGREREAGPAEESVKLVVAFSRPLAKYSTKSTPTVLTRILDESELRTPSGKKIKIERVPMTSPEMVEGVLNGSLKAHVLIPTSDVYLDLIDREWTLRTGKPIASTRVLFMHQPYVLAVRRPMAEAMGWPTKDIGWADVVEVARDGWKAVGHPEWGSLKMLLMNPEFSDAGLHSVASIALGTLEKSKGLNSEDLNGPALAAALKAIDDAVVWYPSTIDDLLRNEQLAMPSRCHMTFLPEHLMLELNERSARRKAPPDWVAIYPSHGTVVDGVTGAVVQREWVTEEQREAAAVALQLFKTPKVQKRIMAMGYRPALSDIALTGPLTQAMGVDPKSPRETIEMPPVEVILDCLSAWGKTWKLRSTGASDTVNSAKPMPATPVSIKSNSNVTPTVLCVHRAGPSSVTIRHSDTRKVKGSGVIVDARGYAITNAHVVGKDRDVAVSFFGADDKVYAGEVAYVAPNRDLAIVRILAPAKFRAIKFADPGEHEVGETVVAIGNPLGYTGTVTVGIISAFNRDIIEPSGAVLKKVIQTSAPINPGNSGGALLDIDGELLGIVFAERSGAQNIAFAIPADHVRAYLKKCLPD